MGAPLGTSFEYTRWAYSRSQPSLGWLTRPALCTSRMRSTEGTLSRGRSPSAPRLDVTSLASVSHLAGERCGRISSPSTRGSLLCGWRSTGPCARMVPGGMHTARLGLIWECPMRRCHGYLPVRDRSVALHRRRVAGRRRQQLPRDARGPLYHWHVLGSCDCAVII